MDFSFMRSHTLTYSPSQVFVRKWKLGFETADSISHRWPMKVKHIQTWNNKQMNKQVWTHLLWNGD